MSFFASRWRGEAPLDRLFWRDMVLFGTLLNLATTAAALALLELKFSLPVVLAVHLSPLPYNIFLLAAVWNTADAAGSVKAAIFRGGALLWFLAATII
jgi:hypothetical protein